MAQNGSMVGKWARRLGFGALILVLAGGLLTCSLSSPRPELEPGPEADALARRMMEAVNHEAWLNTGAVRWDFGGRQRHLWDRRRQLAEVTWGNHRVMIDLSRRQGIAWTDDEPVAGRDLDDLVDKAWSHWVNDSFWLNPVSKAFDDGTSRGVVSTEEGQGLLVSYASGGVTPGDAYLWLLDDQALPVAWKMWTQILPIGGIRAGWEDWIQLDTGARISTRHPMPAFELVLSDVQGAESLSALVPGPDPFEPLLDSLRDGADTNNE